MVVLDSIATCISQPLEGVHYITRLLYTVLHKTYDSTNGTWFHPTSCNTSFENTE